MSFRSKTSSFVLYPAIDLKGGQVVRLLKGDLAAATVYSACPHEQARAWADVGFPWLHVVDLDGATQGKSINRGAVDEILAAVNGRMKVQLGGGLRSRAHIDAWLNAGVDRAILGSVAVRDPDLVAEAARAYPDQIVVGIDARDGWVATDGWVKTSQTSALEVAKRFEACGVAALIYTDINRDGALSGVNIEATTQLAAAVSTPVIASGGLRDLQEVRALKTTAVPLAGVIAGRALYDGRLDPQAALAASWR